MEVSIIIVNYNTCEMTAAAIKSIQDMTHGLKYEIILVDNASTDGSKEYFENRKDVTYIYSAQNLGFGQANNLAAKQAKGKCLFFLNSDTLLRNNAIKILHHYINTHIEIGAVGGNLFNIDGQPTISFERHFPGIYGCINLLSHNLLNRIRFGKNVLFNYTEETIDVAYISGADLMIRAELFQKLKGFSNDYFMYYEETDLCFRIQESGYRMISVPDAKIIHLEGGSFKRSTESTVRKFKTSLSSRATFMKKYHNRLYIWIDSLFYCLYLIIFRRVHNNTFSSIDLNQYYRHQLKHVSK